jgi:hypothetical protein
MRAFLMCWISNILAEVAVPLGLISKDFFTDPPLLKGTTRFEGGRGTAQFSI